MGATADDDGEGVEARFVESFAGGFGDEISFVVGKVDGFAVRTLSGEAGDTGFGEADCVFGCCGEVEVFVVFEEGDSWDVDAGLEWSAHGDVVHRRRGGAVEGVAGLRERGVDGTYRDSNVG